MTRIPFSLRKRRIKDSRKKRLAVMTNMVSIAGNSLETISTQNWSEGGRRGRSEGHPNHHAGRMSMSKTRRLAFGSHYGVIIRDLSAKSRRFIHLPEADFMARDPDVVPND